jgi:hypothetical protein
VRGSRSKPEMKRSTVVVPVIKNMGGLRRRIS